MWKTNKDFRNFLLHSTFSGIGGGMFGIFMMWAVHAVFGNSFYTGLAGVMFALPNVASFAVGPLVDRANKAVVMRIANLVQVAAVGCLLAFTTAFEPNIWLFLGVILLYGIASMVKGPAATALLPKIVESSQLMRANVSVRIAATVAGLGIGVLLYMMFSDGSQSFLMVYGVNAAVLGVALLFSLLLRDGVEAKTEKARYATELKEGFAFVRKRLMLHLVMAFLVMGLFANIAYVNLPLFAEIHTGTAQGYILLSALALVGGVIGSYFCRAVGDRLDVWKILVGAFVLAGVARIVFVHMIVGEGTRFIWIYLLYVGIGSMVGIIFQTLMQKLPPKNLIARINTITTSLFAIFAAIGAFLGGFVTTIFVDADMAFIIQGGSYIAIGLILCASKQIRSLGKIDEVEAI